MGRPQRFYHRVKHVEFQCQNDCKCARISVYSSLVIRNAKADHSHANVKATARPIRSDPVTPCRFACAIAAPFPLRPSPHGACVRRTFPCGVPTSLSGCGLVRLATSDVPKSHRRCTAHSIRLRHHSAPTVIACSNDTSAVVLSVFDHQR